MSNQLYVKMNVKFLVEDITPEELWTYFHSFLDENSHLISQSGRKKAISIVDSGFTSILKYDLHDNEREFLDAKGNLIYI